MSKRRAHPCHALCGKPCPERKSRGHFEDAIRRQNPQTKRVIVVTKTDTSLRE
jgi:hypothetical protein